MKFLSLDFSHFRSDFGAGLSVFLVALPLCLGIALASGAPLLAGLMAGIVGGTVVTLLSGSEVSVSGPAAGLTVVVATAIKDLGSYEAFLVAVVLAGAMQLAMGVLQAGKLSGYVPGSVIKGMLVAIGVVIILKQIPHALGWDADPEGEFEFSQLADGKNTFSEIAMALSNFSTGAIIISASCLVLLFLWDKLSPRFVFFRAFPSGLAVVLLGVALNLIFKNYGPELYLGNSPTHMVNVPNLGDFDTFVGSFRFPNFAAISDPRVLITAFTLGVVASLETLLSLEASEKIDPQRRFASPNKELIAQGIGNMISGAIGGLPITSVVVRTSANVYAGSKTRLSVFVHGVLLALAVFFIPNILNFIPLACLAALLISVGYKLAKVDIFVKMYKEGQDQFIPFFITVLAIIFTDLLKGIGVGLVFGLMYVLYTNNRSAFTVVRDNKFVLINLNKDVFFLNKVRIKTALGKLKTGDYVFIDATRAQFIDPDIRSTLQEFGENAHHRGITVEIRNLTRRKQK